MRELYTYFGFELPPETVEAMRKHAEGHRKDRHGKHEYSLQMYGLSEAAVRDRLAAYIDRFGLPTDYAVSRTTGGVVAPTFHRGSSWDRIEP